MGEVMRELINWVGKSEDIAITYDADIASNKDLLVASDFDKKELPDVFCDRNQTDREIVDIKWDSVVKTADREDYFIAITCGAITGLLDIFFVGELSLERANTWGEEKINDFVKRAAKLNGGKGESLEDSISFFERKYKFAADSETATFGGGLQHHLRDFSHHFSLGGLLCSLFTQFTGKVIGTNTQGKIIVVELRNKTLIGKSFEEKILFGIVRWFYHMVSDMAGTRLYAGDGTGIPGPMLSLIKNLSALPYFRDKKINEIEFHIWVSKLFNGTLLAKRDEKGKIVEKVRFNLRTEIGLLNEVGRQFIPVLVNECFVRGLYFLRRLYISMKNTEIHSISDFKKIDASELLPFNNRVIRRMITVSSGIFAAIDITGATVVATLKNKGLTSEFFVDFFVRVNIIGVGRFVIAIKEDGASIAEDIRKAKENRVRFERDFEEMIADLKCFSLTYEQMRVLCSLKKLLILDDILHTSKEESRKIKSAWNDEWERQILASVPNMYSSPEQFFMSEDSVAKFFSNSEHGAWQYLIAMELMLFRPYYSIYCNEKDRDLKKVHFRSKYLIDKFTKLQNNITKEDIDILRKYYKKANTLITGSTKKMIMRAASTTAVTILSGGFAFTFAPAIASALMGGQAAIGLSGAALTSYSLAAVGGGSLAAGGLGMAGGTAIITGGGAFVGLISGTSISAATAIDFLAQDGYVLSECCRLLTFSQLVLFEKYSDYHTIADIYKKLNTRIDILQRFIDGISNNIETDDKEIRKKQKNKIRIAKKSMEYLKNCSESFQKLLIQINKSVVV